MDKKNMGGKALLPIGLFLVLSLGTALITGSGKSVPALIFFSIAAGASLMMNREKSFWDKMDIFTSGFGNPNIIVMVLIFLLAGAFSTVSKETGCVSSVVNFALSYLPTHLIVGGLFVIGCFMSLATGTSVGTVVALAPIAVGVVDKTGISLPFIMGAVISGGMFGDNLSVISDTTISATRICNVAPKDKFKANFLIALPAAIVAFTVFTMKSSGIEIGSLGNLEYSLVKIIPYIVVLASSLAGINVFFALIVGIILSGGIGLFTGAYTLVKLANIIHSGMMGMASISFVVLIVGGMIALVKENGGVEWIISHIKHRITNTKQAEFAIAFLTMALTLCVANSTVAIVSSGSIAMDITEEYNVNPIRTASLLDIFACGSMGTLVPYGGMILATAGASGTSPMEIMLYATYPQAILVFAVIAIATGFPKMKK